MLSDRVLGTGFDDNEPVHFKVLLERAFDKYSFFNCGDIINHCEGILQVDHGSNFSDKRIKEYSNAKNKILRQIKIEERLIDEDD